MTYRRTKIVATIGPVTNSKEMLAKLIDAGLNVARLNFSHGRPEDHLETISIIRQLSKEKGREVGILQDLSGPKIRLGEIKEQYLADGTTVLLTPDLKNPGEALPVNYPYLLEDVSVDERVLLFDGKIELKVMDKNEKNLVCQVLTGGKISSHKGVNLPHSNLRIEAFTDKDRADLAVGLAGGVDFVAMSFVRSAQDLTELRKLISQAASPPLLIAKIEKPQAVLGIEEIMEVVDGIMVARGDLGVEMPIEEVPITQKMLIKIARRHCKPVITATQMLGSMTDNPRPSRAEVTDVANAILDGTDAVMLSEETTVGKYPVEAVAMLDKISRQTEPVLDNRKFLAEPSREFTNPMASAITRAVCILALDMDAKVIVAATEGGSTARLVSRWRQPTPVVGLTANLVTARQLSISWGVMPALIQSCETISLLEKITSEWLLKNNIASPGDQAFLTCGLPLQTTGTTNLIKHLNLS